MKKLPKIIFVLVFIFSISQEQVEAQKFSVQGEGGYNFSAPGSTLGIITTYSSSTSEVYHVAKGSLGAGWSVGIAGSYKICDHVAINLAVSFLKSKQQVGGGFSGFNYYVSDSNTFNANTVRILPGVIFSCNEEKRIQPFLRSELVIAFSNMEDESIGHLFNGTSGVYQGIINKQGGIGIGFGTALGILYKINNVTAISLEVNGIYQTFAYTHGEATKYMEDGVNISPINSHFVYIDTITPTGQSNASSTLVTFKTYYPFSSLGMKAGMRFAF